MAKNETLAWLEQEITAEALAVRAARSGWLIVLAAVLAAVLVTYLVLAILPPAPSAELREEFRQGLALQERGVVALERIRASLELLAARVYFPGTENGGKVRGD